MQKNVLVIVTGSVACYKALDVVSSLKKKGFFVKVVMTPAAQRFVLPTAFEAVIGEPVHTDLWESGHLLDHIHLVRWASIIVVLPATAHFLASMTQGLGSGLAEALSLAHDFQKPFVIFPAMNPHMWRHPATQSHIKTLRAWGYEVIPPDEGVTACGEIGEGRLPSPEAISEYLTTRLGFLNRAPIRVVITGGGTRVFIDKVRYLSNFSTGKTSVNLAKEFLSLGCSVSLCLSRNHQAGDELRNLYLFEKMDQLSLGYFESPEELEDLVDETLARGPFRALFHLAAVSDFFVEAQGSTLNLSESKISSDQIVVLNLLPRKKSYKSWEKFFMDSKPGVDTNAFGNRPELILWKLTMGGNFQAAVDRLFQESLCHWVVHNDGLPQDDQRKLQIYSRGRGQVVTLFGTRELARFFWQLWVVEGNL